MTVRVAGLLLAVMLVGVAAPAEMAQIDEEHLVRMDYETPHVAWGKPWLKGTIKALMFCVGKYDSARDAVEMMQRFDMDITTVYLRTNRKVIHFTTANVDREVEENPPDSDGVQRVRRLLRGKWDLFVFGNADPDVLPPELQYYLYSQVAQGAGVLCVGPRGDKVMTQAREIEEPPGLFPLGVKFWDLPAARGWVKEGGAPADLEGQLVHAYRLGKGRGVHLALPNPLTLTPNLPASPENINETEYWYALAGELAIWAASRDVDLSEAAARAKRVAMQTRLARLDGFELPWEKAEKDVDAAAGEVSIEVTRTDLPAAAGLYVQGILLDVDGKRAGFMASVLTSPVVTPYGVQAIALHRDYCEPGESLEGTISLGDADYTGRKLRLETRDAWGRVLARQDVDLAADTRQVPFSLPTTEDCSAYIRLEASVWEGEEQDTAPKVAEFQVPQRRRGMFHQVMWDAPSSAVGYWAMLRLRQLGYDVILGGLKPTLGLADMPLIPYTTRLMEEQDEQGTMEPCCWNDPEKSEEWIKGIAAAQEGARKHGVYVYSLGDETTTKGCCESEFCLQTYRRYLRDQYGDVEALNRSWGTQYSSFDEVQLSAPGDNYEKTAFQQGNYPRWFDRLAYSQWNYLQLNARFGREYEALDPQALTGFEGAGGFGDDIEAVVKTNGFYNPYPSIADELLRSIAPKGYIRGNWIGYQRDAEPLLYWYWRIVMNGCPCVFWWRWDGIGMWHGYLAPDFEPYAATAEMDRDTAVVRQGLGDLLVAADREDDGIALLYSVPAAQADKLPDSKAYGGVQAAHETWVNLTKGAGFGFRYVTDRQVEAGELRHGIKVLVLPFTRPISDKTAEEVRAFAEAGGTVLADLRPGEFTGHLARRLAPVLDDLFGVEHAAEGKPEVAEVRLDIPMGNERLRCEIPRAHVETALTVAAGKAAATAAETPLVITRDVGKGRAVLLNFAVADLAGVEAGDSGPEVRRFISALYRSCGVRPAATVDSDDPQVLLNTGAWRAGKLLVYGVQMRNYRYGGGRYVLRLAEPRHVYDLRDGKYLGRKRELSAPAYRTRFFVLAADEVAPVVASVDKRGYSPGETVSLRLSRGKGSPEGIYPVAVTLWDPSGAEQLWARRAVVMERTETVRLQLGLNAAGGQWELAVRDLVTGETTDLGFTVTGDAPCLWPGCYVRR